MLVLYSISIYYLITINNMADTNYISVIKTSDGKLYNIKDIDARKRMTEITWSRLKQLRDNSQLIPGMQYRITNYHTFTTQKDTTSANHQFDVIVTADSTNKLNESARAIQHSGDTYFSGCNLAAWKIWYCLDNDKKRFAWADTDGKGVIYRMIDEHNNDCPYDFKNIQFLRYYANVLNSVSGSKIYGYDYVGLKHYATNEGTYRGILGIDTTKRKYFYTFSEDNGSNIIDATIDSTYYSSNNVIGISHTNVTIDDNSFYTSQYLNNIITVFTGSIDYKGGYGCNKFGIECFNCTLINCKYNTIGNSCSDIILGSGCLSNTILNTCSNIYFACGCSDNSVATKCNYIGLSENNSCKNDFKDCLDVASTFALNGCILCGSEMHFHNANGDGIFNNITVSLYNNENNIDLAEHLTIGVNYSQFVCNNSKGEIVSYTLDKIINS